MSYRTRKAIAALALLVLFGIVYSQTVPTGTKWDVHLYNLSLGLLTGFVVLFVQFCVDSERDAELEVLQQTRIKKVLLTRDDEQYYASLIKQAKKRVLVMGVTCQRFMQDFADIGSPREDKKILIAALARQVECKILVASEGFLTDGVRAKYAEAQRLLAALPSDIRAKIEVRFYQHVPSLAMVVCDEDCLVGSVFPHIPSKNTATIHLRGGILMDQYLNNFEAEWAAALLG